jgi:hypothetical protein
MRNVKLFFHKLTNWEYWPYQVVYFPVYFQYLFFAARAKSFFFFNAANPSIKNGGFFMESKKEIYDLIPQKYYPKTILIPKATPTDEIVSKISDSHIQFPVIAKPDMGLRGTAVKKLYNKKDIESYALKAKFNFLIQDTIPYDKEIGLFYVKLPNLKHGTITGIVEKEFLIVTGNGQNTIREILNTNPRYEFQLKVLEEEYGDKLDEVLSLNESINLVPYGNHCRGTKFIDASCKITPKMIATFNAICSEIEGFYYGRMDIMFSNYEDLENGENFQIVEINGAISEPTHIYDPKHSILYGWKELLKHYNYLFQISLQNNQKGHPYLSFKEGVTEFKKHNNYYNTILDF